MQESGSESVASLDFDPGGGEGIEIDGIVGLVVPLVSVLVVVADPLSVGT